MLINVEMMGREAVSAHPSHLAGSEFLVTHLPSVHTSGERCIRYVSLMRLN